MTRIKVKKEEAEQSKAEQRRAEKSSVGQSRGEQTSRGTTQAAHESSLSSTVPFKLQSNLQVQEIKSAQREKAQRIRKTIIVLELNKTSHFLYIIQTHLQLLIWFKVTHSYLANRDEMRKENKRKEERGRDAVQAEITKYQGKRSRTRLQEWLK